MSLSGFFSFLKGNAFARNSAILFAGTMAMNVINYVFHLVIGRMVTPEAYGEVESLFSLLAVVSVPALTVSIIATRYAAKAKADKNAEQGRQLFHYLEKKILLYGSSMLLLSLLLAPFVRDFLNLHSVLPIVLIFVTIFLAFFTSAIAGIFNGWQSFSKANTLNISGTGLKLVFGVLFVWVGLGATGVALAVALSATASYFIGRSLLKALLTENGSGTGAQTISDIPTESLRKYVLPALLGSLAVTILGNVDMMFARHALEADTAGSYGALSVAAKTIFFVTGVLTTVLFSVAAERSHRKDDTKRLFFFVFSATAALAFGAAAVFSLFPELVLRILFGSTYLPVAGLLSLFSITAASYALANLTLQYLLSLHRTEAVSFFFVVSALEIAFLSLFGTGIHAIIGITLAAQWVAIIGGLVFVFFQKTSLYVEENIDSYAGL